jgi:hypothetical protein
VVGSDSALSSGTIATAEGGGQSTLPDVSVVTSALGVGVWTIELAVDDGTNDAVVAAVEVTVVDTTAPTLSLDGSPTILWPPNHELVTVVVTTDAHDDGGAVTLSAEVESDEPDDGLGDGDTSDDIQDLTVNQTTGAISVKLRAERSGRGDGRTYTITVTATDGSGNSSIATCEVIVPKSKGKAR